MKLENGPKYRLKIANTWVYQSRLSTFKLDDVYCIINVEVCLLQAILCLVLYGYLLLFCFCFFPL